MSQTNVSPEQRSSPAVLKLIGFVLCVFGVALLFTMIRLQVPLVGEDASHVGQWRQVPESAQGFSWSAAYQEAFGHIGSHGYQPLMDVVGQAGTAFFGSDLFPAWVWLFWIGLLVGGFAWMLFWIFRRFLRTRGFAFFGVLLVVASEPFLASMWTVFSSPAVIGLFVWALGFLIYLKITDPSRMFRVSENVVLYVGFILTLLLAPYASAFAVFLPLLILLGDACIRSRLTTTTILAMAGLIHAFFPTLVARYVVDASLPIEPFYRLGAWGQALAFSQSQVVNHVDRFWGLVMTVSPGIVMALFLIAIVFALRFDGQSRRAFTDVKNLRIVLWSFVSFVLAFAAAVCVPDRELLVLTMIPFVLLAMFLIEKFYFEYEVLKKMSSLFAFQMLAVVMIGVSVLDHGLGVVNSLMVTRALIDGERDKIRYAYLDPFKMFVLQRWIPRIFPDDVSGSVEVGTVRGRLSPFVYEVRRSSPKAVDVAQSLFVNEDQDKAVEKVDRSQEAREASSAEASPDTTYAVISLAVAGQISKELVVLSHHTVPKVVSSGVVAQESVAPAMSVDRPKQDNARDLVAAGATPVKTGGVSAEQALAIAGASSDARSFLDYNNGQFRGCVTPRAVRPCDSNWVTCIDNAWVVEYVAGEACGFEHDGRVSLRLLIDEQGNVISRFPEKDYFTNPVFCMEDYDCLSVGEEDRECLNFIYAQTDPKLVRNIGGCICKRKKCSEGK